MSTLDNEIAALLHALSWDAPATDDDGVAAEIAALMQAVRTTPTKRGVLAAAVRASKPPKVPKVPKPATVLSDHEKWLRKQRSLVTGLQTRITKYEADLAYGREHPEDSAHALFAVIPAEVSLPGVRVRLAQLEQHIASAVAREARENDVTKLRAARRAAWRALTGR